MIDLHSLPQRYQNIAHQRAAFTSAALTLTLIFTLLPLLQHLIPSIYALFYSSAGRFVLVLLDNAALNLIYKATYAFFQNHNA